MPRVHCRQGTDTFGSFNGTRSLSQSQLLLASPSATNKHRVVYWPRGNWGYEKALVLRTGGCRPLPEELWSRADLLKCWTAGELHSGTAPGQVKKRTWLRTLHRNGRWAGWPKVGSFLHTGCVWFPISVQRGQTVELKCGSTFPSCHEETFSSWILGISLKVSVWWLQIFTGAAGCRNSCKSGRFARESGSERPQRNCSSVTSLSAMLRVRSQVTRGNYEVESSSENHTTVLSGKGLPSCHALTLLPRSEAMNYF